MEHDDGSFIARRPDSRRVMLRPKVLRNLKIAEVSAVDAGAGENCEILLMKRDQDVIGRATTALEECVYSIATCDADDETKRAELVENFAQFEGYLERELGVSKARSKGPLERAERARRQKFAKIFTGKADLDGGDDDDDEIAKARIRHDVGGKGLATAVSEHVLDMIDFHRRRFGIAKGSEQTEKETSMDSVEKIAADHGVHALAKMLVDDQSAHQIDEHRWVRLVTAFAKREYPTLTEAQAFQKVFLADDEAGRLLQRAHQITKAATANFDVTIVTPGDATYQTVNETEQSEAYQTLEALASKLHEAATGRGEKLTKEQSFARVFESNPELARRAHRTPVGGSTHYPMPNFNLLGSRR